MKYKEILTQQNEQTEGKLSVDQIDRKFKIAANDANTEIGKLNGSLLKKEELLDSLFLCDELDFGEIRKTKRDIEDIKKSIKLQEEINEEYFEKK